MSSETVIVDLSHHNPEPDWKALKKGGVVGVILKATEGLNYRDETFHDRFTGATAAGLGVSSYHFLHTGSVPQQMENYLDYVQPDPGDRLCLDHESDATLDDLIEAVKYLKANTQCELTVYSGSLIREQVGAEYIGALAANTSLWIAQYTDAAAPSWPKNTWPVWSLWQFTDSATVAGIPVPVDGNRFNGSAKNALKWLGPPEVTPKPPQPTPGNMAVVSIQTSPGIDLMLVVNGRVIPPPKPGETS